MLLEQPGTIGPLRLKNRVIMAPMGTNYGTTDGFSTDRDTRYYGERAKGGVALIVTEEIEAEKVLVVLYMKNGAAYAVTNYCAADGKLHPDFLRRREHNRSG